MRIFENRYFKHYLAGERNQSVEQQIDNPLKAYRKLMFASIWAALFGLWLISETVKVWFQDGAILLVDPILGAYLLIHFGFIALAAYKKSKELDS